MATGATFPDGAGKGYMVHHLSIFENSDGFVGGSCGSPIVEENGRVVSLLRCQTDNGNLCISVSATEILDYGYTPCLGEHAST